MMRPMRMLHVLLLGAVVFGLGAYAWAAKFPIARIYIEYNQTRNYLGYHLSL